MSAEQWAIVEVMGHRRHVGLTSEVVRYGVTLLCVEAVIGHDINERRTHLYPGASLFGVIPITEEEAKREVTPLTFAVGQLPAATSADKRAGARWEWIEQLIQCATLAHDGAAAAMTSSDQDITDKGRGALKALVTLVEVGIAERHITAEGVPPDDIDKGPDSDAPDSQEW